MKVLIIWSLDLSYNRNQRDRFQTHNLIFICKQDNVVFSFSLNIKVNKKHLKTIKCKDQMPDFVS